MDNTQGVDERILVLDMVVEEEVEEVLRALEEGCVHGQQAVAEEVAVAALLALYNGDPKTRGVRNGL